MYAGRVAFWPIVSHVAYAPRDLLRSVKNGAGRRTDGRHTVTLRVSDADIVMAYTHIQGGPTKVVPTDVFACNIWMP